MGRRSLASFSCRSSTWHYRIGRKDEIPCALNRGGGNTGPSMLKHFVATVILLAASAGSAPAASAVNRDSEPRTLIVTEGGTRAELPLAAGETVEFCPNGCFVTMPNGDLEALTGVETIEISGGVARIK